MFKSYTGIQVEVPVKESIKQMKGDETYSDFISRLVKLAEVTGQ